jgi:protoheme IX farnesyltransferase
LRGDVDILDDGIIRVKSRLLSFVELMKPELTGLSVLTALCGFYLGTSGLLDFRLFLLAGIGTLLVGGGAGTLNQFVEREYDSMMRRTEKRPLPSGRVTPTEVLWFGITLSLVGIVLLALCLNLFTGFLATLTITTYLFLYTPLKRITPIATLVGGIPGALPPMMGWVAARNEISVPAVVLFAILFFWQIPHFHSLAWVYRKDYARAGFRMLTVLDADGTRTSRQMLLCTSALVPSSLGLALAGVTGNYYLIGALILGVAFLGYGVLFARVSGNGEASALAKSNVYAWRMFSASLLYLPALMILMTIDKV